MVARPHVFNIYVICILAHNTLALPDIIKIDERDATFVLFELIYLEEENHYCADSAVMNY